jgi:hypothetical protein
MTDFGNTQRARYRLLTFGVLCFAAGSMLTASQPAWAGLEIESWQTENGARVLFLESRNLPILDVNVEFPAGSGRDEPGKEGLARMTLALMKKGTQSLDEIRISEQLAGIGAQLSGTIDLDRSGFALRTLSYPDDRRIALGGRHAVSRSWRSAKRVPVSSLPRRFEKNSMEIILTRRLEPASRTPLPL